MPLPDTLTPYAVSAANEGIPVMAIARVLHRPADEVYETLNEQKTFGTIIDLPKSDWPPTARMADRLPMVMPASDNDMAFQVRQMFKLTALEAGFLVVLIKHARVEKTTLHNIVEQQRLTRSAQPNALDATDPKMVDVMICKLRKKLKVLDPAFLITTIWGGGYHVTPDVKAKLLAKLNGAQDEEAPASPVYTLAAGDAGSGAAVQRPSVN